MLGEVERLEVDLKVGCLRRSPPPCPASVLDSSFYLPPRVLSESEAILHATPGVGRACAIAYDAFGKPGKLGKIILLP